MIRSLRRIRSLRMVASLRKTGSDPDMGGRRHTGAVLAIPIVLSQNELLDRRLSSQHLAATMDGSGDVAAMGREAVLRTLEAACA